MDMSEKINKLRKAKGMTLQEVGDIVGVGKSTVRKWESGQIANMRRDKIALLAKALGTTPSYLMGWTDNDEAPREPTAEYYESIGVAARMKPQPEPPVTAEGILQQLQSLERQLKTQISLSPTEQQLINDFRVLPKSAQGKVRAYIDGLFDRLEGK